MPGIAGITYPDVYHIDHLVDHMLTVIQPDGSIDSGVFDKTELGVSDSPLAVNEKQGIIVGIDGSITNHDVLRQELKGKGYKIDECTLPEVIAHGYHEWNSKLFCKLEGEFVLFIYDRNKRRLLLARDRIGIKRLYWYHDDTHFIFSSHIKALLKSKLVQAVPDPQAVAAYLYLGSTPLELSIIQSVNKLPAGHYLQYDLDGFQKIIQYWSYYECFDNQSKSLDQELIHSIDETLHQAVAQRISTDDAVGFVGVGNLGSALLGQSLLAHVSKENLHSFSIGYEGQSNDFIHRAANVAKALDISHHTRYLEKETYLDQLIPVVWNLDEPISSPLALIQYKLGEMAAPITGTLFSQHGCEDILSPQSKYANMKDTVIDKTTLTDLGQFLIRYAIAPLLKTIHPKWALSLLRKKQMPPWNFVGIEMYSKINSVELTKAAPKLSEIFDIKTHLQNLEHLNLLPSSLASVLYYNMKTIIPDFYAIQWERLLSAQGVVWHTPFLDARLACMLAGKFEQNIACQESPNFYLNQLISDTFRGEELDFTHPNYITALRDWLGTSHMQRYFTLLLSGTLVETGIISEEWLKRRIDKFPQSERAFKQLWLILTLEIWFRLFINKEYTECPKDLTLYELLHEL